MSAGCCGRHHLAGAVYVLVKLASKYQASAIGTIIAGMLIIDHRYGTKVSREFFT